MFIKYFHGFHYSLVNELQVAKTQLFIIQLDFRMGDNNNNILLLFNVIANDFGETLIHLNIIYFTVSLTAISVTGL